MRSRLKKRLRKKYRVGEFQELGFEISIEFVHEFYDADFDKFIDEFLETIEKERLLFGGGGGNKTWQGFATAAKRFSSPSIENQERIKIWLKNQPIVEKFELGILKDAWK